MARPEQRTARKDYPESKIKKGEKYWYVQIKTGPRSSRTLRQINPFKRSQLTTSDFLQQLYDWEDLKGSLTSMDDADDLVTTIRELGEEQESKKDGMPDSLQNGSTGELLAERAAACEAAADEMENIISEWETARDEYSEALKAYEEQQEKIDGEEDRSEDEELDEPEDPESGFIQQIVDVEVNL